MTKHLARQRLVYAVVLGLLAALGPLCTDLYLPALPEMAGELNTSTAAAQLSLTTGLLGLGVGQLIFGPYSDKLGRMRPLLLSLILLLGARAKSPNIKIETLVPDFRGRMDRALEILTATPPDVFNHNLENVPRVYRQVRPGANYEWSLKLLERFKEAHPDIPTKSGLMVGLGETNAEIVEVMRDLRRHGVTMLTLGQYLQPSRHHLPVQRYVSPAEFDEMKEEAMAMGFTHAACGPFVRSSYHADLQAKGMEVK